MAIEDPKDAYKQQYLAEEQSALLDLSNYVKAGLPIAALPLEIFKRIADTWNGTSTNQRIRALFELLVAEIGHIESTKADKQDIEEAVRLIFHRDNEQRNDKKRERYVKIIGNALRSESQVLDVASFIRVVEQLNERDIIVLKVLNTVMNKKEDWKYSGSFGGVKLHPSNLISRSKELAEQVAMALGQKIETNTFSREVGYGICHRLQGFGLAHEVQPEARELPVGNYCFRLSTMGITLLKLLGEDVPNSSFYND